jgi:uncharacterized lipoprotein YbaY/uncharacterized membrane protein
MNTDTSAGESTPDARATIRGSAFYREKILLPPGVELRVQLIDNQLADTQQAVVAQQTFRGIPGPPYAFALDYDPAKLRSNGSYGLHAGLYSPGGELLFVTDTRVPVTPGGTDTIEFRLIRVDTPAAGGGVMNADETRWQCGEMIVATRFAGDRAEVRIPGTTLRLQQQASASGAKYGDTDGSAFWMKGDSAMFTLQDEQARDCTRTERRSPWDDARARGVALRAVGNEPGWFAEVDRGETPRLRAELDYGGRKVEVASAQPLMQGDATGFRGTTTDGDALELRIRRVRCHDDMSGHPYPASAELIIGGSSYRGCAAFLDE